MSHELTPRQEKILKLFAEGNTNREISGKLFFGEETIKTEVKRLRAKLGASNRAHAVAIGFRTGLLP